MVTLVARRLLHPRRKVAGVEDGIEVQSKQNGAEIWPLRINTLQNSLCGFLNAGVEHAAFFAYIPRIMQAKAALTLHIWRHIAVRLPADWEMLQFSCEFSQGRCAFADRYQYRSELSWRTVPGEPDYDRMVNDYFRKLEQDKRIDQGEIVKKSGWHGLAGVIDRERTSRLGKYLPAIGCLIEFVILWPQQRDVALENEILGSIEARPPAKLQEWQAFNMNMHVPAAAAFEGCTALPARTEFTFTDTKTANQWQFSRRGMVASWFDGQLEPWLRRELGKNTRELRITQRHHHDADMIIAEGRFKPQSLHLRRGNVTAAAWIDPADGRLYCAKKWLRRTVPSDDLPVHELLRRA